MTEYNLFCYSKNYNDINSFQQKRYRVFNKEVGKEKYFKVLGQVKEIIPNKDSLKLYDYWKGITQEQWKQLLAIREANDFKEGFEYISGQKIITIPDLKGKVVEVKIDGQEYKAVIQ